MFRVIDHGGHTFTLSSYQARGNDTYNAKIEVHIKVGESTPTEHNWFTCGYATLREATTALRRQWEIIRKSNKPKRGGSPDESILTYVE